MHIDTNKNKCSVELSQCATQTTMDVLTNPPNFAHPHPMPELKLPLPLFVHWSVHFPPMNWEFGWPVVAIQIPLSLASNNASLP